MKKVSSLLFLALFLTACNQPVQEVDTSSSETNEIQHDETVLLQDDIPEYILPPQEEEGVQNEVVVTEEVTIDSKEESEETIAQPEPVEKDPALERVEEYLRKAEEAKEKLRQQLEADNKVSFFEFIPTTYAQEEVSVEDLLAEIELNIELAAEAAEDIQSLETLGEVLADIQETQEGITSELADISEGGSEDVLVAITETAITLNETGQNIEDAIIETEEAIESGETEVEINVETMAEELFLDEKNVNKADLLKRKLEKKRSQVEALRLNLLGSGLSEEKVQEIIEVHLMSLTSLEQALQLGNLNIWQSLRMVTQELKIIDTLTKKSGITEDELKAKLHEKKTERETKKKVRMQEKEAVWNAIREQVESGVISKRDVRSLLHEKKIEKQKEKIEARFEKLKDKNPENEALYRKNADQQLKKKEEVQERLEGDMKGQKEIAERIQEIADKLGSGEITREEAREMMQIVREEREEKKEEKLEALKEDNPEKVDEIEARMDIQEAIKEKKEEMRDEMKEQRETMKEMKDERKEKVDSGENVSEEEKQALREGLKESHEEIKEKKQEARQEIQEIKKELEKEGGVPRGVKRDNVERQQGNLRKESEEGFAEHEEEQETKELQ